eukprot:CAMPEP_0167781770 /NCGR_PEP_ID=MMETSP0111_2-20121227/6121_1 /TAXON_ID=91324 /ORGANISM="Lotharella globosa, Strain CCCM811" /LENGTH=37 /DNA_ID= /DNA_START= /DNA_END= /DNA_ORIENTATION=
MTPLDVQGKATKLVRAWGRSSLLTIAITSNTGMLKMQ